jgi:CHAT domain-containing protein/Tfp pilus assembly protein PilF
MMQAGVTRRVIARSNQASRLLRVAMVVGLVTWCVSPAAASVRKLPAQERTPLAIGVTIRREMGGGDSHLYTIAVADAGLLKVSAEQVGIDIVLTLLGPDGAPISEVDRPNGSHGPETLSARIDVPGVYTLTVRSWVKSAAVGTYTLQVEPSRTLREADEKVIAAEQAVTDGEKLRARGTADDYRAGARRFEQAAALWRELGSQYEEAVANYGAAWCSASLGENYEAVKLFNLSLPVMQELGGRHGEALVRAGLAWAYMYLGDVERSSQNFARSLELHKSLSNARGEAIALHGLGWTHALRGEDVLAAESFARALTLRRAAKDRRGEALTLVGLGKIAGRQRRFEEALSHFNLALDVLRDLGDRYAEADTLSQIGWINLASGRAGLALEYFERSLPLRQLVGDRAGEATTLFGIARALKELGRVASAASRMEESLRVVETLRSETANLQLRTSYFASVREYYEFAVGLLTLLHTMHPGHGYDVAGILVSERAKARSLRDLLEEAQINIREGVPQELLDRRARLQRQLAAAAQRQAQLMSRKGTEREAAAATAEVRELLRQSEEVDAEIREVSPNYASLTQPVQLTLRDIRGAIDPDTVLLEYFLAEGRSNLWVVTSDGLSVHALPARERIESAVQRTLESLTSRNTASPGERPEARRARVAQADAAFSKLAAELSEMILAPAISEVMTRKRVLVVAEGLLEYVPFAALPHPAATASASRGKPLVADREVVSIPSAYTLITLRKALADKTQARKALAVFADPVFAPDDERLGHTLPTRTASGAAPRRGVSMIDRGAEARQVPSLQPPPRGQSLPRLFSTSWEAKEIFSLSGRRDSLLALGFDVKRETVTSSGLEDYRVIHFATHAVVDDADPSLSSLVLSLVDEGGKAREGLLNVQDVFNLRLNADLVVLSACRTGAAKQVTGEGLTGLTRGFLYAGARRVLVSLWAVDDKATAELMVRFYRHFFREENPSPAAALRSAQLEMLAVPRWGPAYFWAGFTLRGEWDRNKR